MSNVDTTGHPEPTPIPTPPDFPVTWETPDDERTPWELDRMHFPDPLPPLEGELWCRIFHNGFNPATEAYEMPMKGRARLMNTYLYSAIVPTVPPEEMEAQGKRSEEKLGAAIARLSELWHGEWLPEIQSHLAWWDAFDLRGATMSELLAHLDETIDR